MLTKNNLSIYRKLNYDYCLAFSGNGYIAIDALTPFLDHNLDFSFEMQFKINSLPISGCAYLMNSCLNKNNNKIGIAIYNNTLFVQVDKGVIGKTEFYISFSDARNWHTISISNNRGALSSLLDKSLLNANPTPSLSLPYSLGFRIASDTNNVQNLNGLADNILITNLSIPLAKYLLNEGSGIIAYDSIGNNNGSITNGQWLQR